MTKLEEVAIAISGAPFPTKASLRKARAAIEALREPSEGMAKAGRFYALDFEDGWVAAIDAALSEEG